MPSPPPTTAHRTAAGSIAPAYFEALYRDQPDPWAYETSTYEAEKYAATLAALPRALYARGLEIGCSIGVLTAALADRCESLLAVDVARAALERAAERCAGLRHVAVQRAELPAETPRGPFDLGVLSEVGYYLAPPDLDALRDRLADGIVAGGTLVLVHWTGETDYPLSADAVHDAFLADARWAPTSLQRTDRYRLDVLVRMGGTG